MQNIDEFYAWERTSRDTIDLKRCYVDIAGDLVSGLLLSQIIYWFLPGDKGNKLRVEKEGRFWLAKGRTDWWEECRISPKQFDRAVKILQDLGLIETKRFRFHGSPTVHIWLDPDMLLQWVNWILTDGEKPIVPSGKNSNSPSSELESDDSVNSLTETTAETNETENTPKTEKADAPPSPSQVDIVFKGIHSFYGYPEKMKEDPIPNYGKEGKAIKKMLDRGFEPGRILTLWAEKTRQRKTYVSMVYVNEDIAGAPPDPKVGLQDPQKYRTQKYAHLVKH